MNWIFLSMFWNVALLQGDWLLMEYVLLMVHCWSALKNIDYFIFLFSYKSVDIFAVELQNRPRMYLLVSRCHTHAHLFILFYWLVLHQIMSNCNGISSMRAKWMWRLIYEIMNITSIFIFFTKYFITVIFPEIFFWCFLQMIIWLPALQRHMPGLDFSVFWQLK